MKNILIIIIIIFPALAFSETRNNILNIIDGEYLKYTYMTGGEHTLDWYFVFRIDYDKRWGKVVRIYQEVNFVKNPKQMPANYSNFDSKTIVSIDRASSVSEIEDYSYLTNERDYKGYFYDERQYDPDLNVLKMTARSWDGTSVKSSNYRVKINPKYPFWDQASAGFLGIQFMNREQEKNFYIVEPEFIKEPIEGSIKQIGTEEIKTGLGSFKTRKVMFNVTDTFLSKLLGPLFNNISIFVDDGPLKCIIRGRNPYGGVSTLSVYSNVLEH